VALGKAAGLSNADIDAAQTGDPNDRFDRAVLNAVDELDEKTNLSDQTWGALSEQLDEQQRMDLIFTIGGYTALAMALNTFGVEIEVNRNDLKTEYSDGSVWGVENCGGLERRILLGHS
jgi:hypothetical protein